MLLIPLKVNAKSQRYREFKLWPLDGGGAADCVTEECRDLGDKFHLLPKACIRGCWQHHPGSWADRKCSPEEGHSRQHLQERQRSRSTVPVTAAGTAALWQPLPTIRDGVSCDHLLNRALLTPLPRIPGSAEALAENWENKCKGNIASAQGLTSRAGTHLQAFHLRLQLQWNF